ncbi:MAG: hypothetical protein FWG69_01465 [Oscillospiraceae bacterium]|nr:hypothetical protein [Oscillospiraceae bacterium]
MSRNRRSPDKNNNKKRKNRRSFYQRHKKFLTQIEGLFLSNTVLERGLVVATVIIRGNSLKNAVGLGLAFALLSFFTVCVTYVVPTTIPNNFRAIINTLVSAGLFIPVAMITNLIITDISVSAGIFLPLLITNSLIVGLSSSRFHKKRFVPMMVDLINHVLGFAVVICFVGFLRELVGRGSVWGAVIPNFPTIPAVLLPFSGFIIVGLFAAVLKKIRFRLAGEGEENPENPENLKNPEN